jgi:outer membrane protein assembly factor BamB
MKSITPLLLALSLPALGQQSGNAAAVSFPRSRSVKMNETGYRPAGNVKWKFKTNGKIFSSPAVADGLILAGSEDGCLYALDDHSGKLKWKFKTGGAVHSSPAVKGNRVYFGSYDGYYYAADLHTGKLAWKFRTGGEKHVGGKGYFGMKPENMEMEDPWDCFLSSPQFIQAGNDPVVCFGSSDGNLYALDARTGHLKWKFKTGGIIHASPACFNGAVYFGSWDTWFYAVDAATGREKWKFKTGEEGIMRGIQSSAVVADGIVYFGSRDANLYALDAESGSLVWKYPAANAWILNSPVIRGDDVLFGTSDTYLLLAVNKKTGREDFRFKTNGYVFGTVAIAGSTAYVGDFTGKMFSVDLDSKGRRWDAFATESRKLHAASVLKDDTLNFSYAARGADLYQYAANVQVMNDFYTLGPIVSSPAVANNLLYFGSADGYLYALELN